MSFGIRNICCWWIARFGMMCARVWQKCNVIVTDDYSRQWYAIYMLTLLHITNVWIYYCVKFSVNICNYYFKVCNSTYLLRIDNYYYYWHYDVDNKSSEFSQTFFSVEHRSPFFFCYSQTIYMFHIDLAIIPFKWRFNN